ncbi:MAG: DUF2007 domain-containing protein [Actinomycetota bacterium]|nr:DUF2007 domain-containing protein [Actinomycetota bacterium]
MGDYRELTAMPFALATVVKGALEAEGLAVRLEREALAGVYGLDSGTFATRILVAAEDLERARALLAEVEASDL